MSNNQNIQPPLPTIEQATAEFHAGVTAAMRSWSALRTAVQTEWGGVDSKEKAEFLRTHILESLDYRLPKPKLEIDDLEDHLAVFMEEEFSIVLEDDSEREVSQLIWQLYQSCGKGDFSLSRQTVASSTNVGNSNEKVAVQCDSDDSDDEMETATTNVQIQAGQYLFGIPNSEIQKNLPAKPRKPKPEPIVDDDGFTMVT
jgi:pre-rRNA-processing protein TSR2